MGFCAHAFTTPTKLAENFSSGTVEHNVRTTNRRAFTGLRATTRGVQFLTCSEVKRKKYISYS